MNKIIYSENVRFDHHELKLVFEKTDTNNLFHVNQLVFYPYYYFEYKLERKSLFHPKGGMIGCTIDGINGIGAIVNTFPCFEKQAIQTDAIIPGKIKSADAKVIAKKFVYDTISYKMKVFSPPPIILTMKEIFYRPYWIVEGGDIYLENKFMLTVDAVTGKYHPL